MSLENIPDNHDILVAEERAREDRWRREVQEYGIGVCNHCGEPVLSYDSRYDVNGVLLHRDCGLDWLDQFKHG